VLSLAGRSFLEIEESMSLRDDITSHRGRVEAVGEGGRFEVRLDSGLLISSGVDKAMRRWEVAIVAGDRVTVEFPEGSPDRARIVFRHLQA
jgi:translation initiation factor IF-1